MYHEGNPGARILGGVCIMKELLGNKFLTNMFFCFFQKKLEHGVCIMNRKSSKTQGKLLRAPFSRISRLHVFFGKNRRRGKKTQSCLEHECPWRTNFPGERISLQNEFPWRTNFPGERILGKFPRKNCGEKHYGETTHLENPNLFLCAGKVLVRKPPWKIPICFYVLEKFWRENPPGKSQFVSIVRWKNSGEKTPSKNSGKQTSAICSLPRIVSVKLVVIGMVLQPVHK